MVPSYEDAIIAARINFNIQACVIKRRFAHHSGRDLSTLEHFVDERFARRPDGAVAGRPRRERSARRSPGSVRNSTCT